VTEVTKAPGTAESASEQHRKAKNSAYAGVSSGRIATIATGIREDGEEKTVERPHPVAECAQLAEQHDPTCRSGVPLDNQRLFIEILHTPLLSHQSQS